MYVFRCLTLLTHGIPTTLQVTSDDIKSVQKKELVPWLLGLPSTLFDHTELYRKLIEWKNKFIR